MTDEERKQIVDDVLLQLRKDSKDIDQLPTAAELSATDNVEVSKGRKISITELAKEMVRYYIDNYVGQHYLSSDNDDVANGNIAFRKNTAVDGIATFGEFVDSISNGKGTGIFPEGRLQTRKLEVDTMTVMDLIVNEIHNMAGEWNFSDCGKIARVELISDADQTYKLYMDKQTDADFTPFEANDICLSVVSNLVLGGNMYYSSWFRVVYKNGDENSITVVLFPDTAVPGGKNYPPEAGYNVTRRGNNQVPSEGMTNERSQSWMLSSKEGRIMFLANVFDPIIKSHNYAVSLGKMPPIPILDQLGLSNDIGLYAQTVVSENFINIDYNGDVIPKKVDRGDWSLAVAQSNKPYIYQYSEKQYPDKKVYTELEQHIVRHKGHRWGCVTSNTVAEPMLYSADWVLIPDGEYQLVISSNQQLQFIEGEYFSIKFEISLIRDGYDFTDEIFKNASSNVEVTWQLQYTDIDSPTLTRTKEFVNNVNTFTVYRGIFNFSGGIVRPGYPNTDWNGKTFSLAVKVKFNDDIKRLLR